MHMRHLCNGEDTRKHTYTHKYAYINNFIFVVASFSYWGLGNAELHIPIWHQFKQCYHATGESVYSQQFLAEIYLTYYRLASKCVRHQLFECYRMILWTTFNAVNVSMSWRQGCIYYNAACVGHGCQAQGGWLQLYILCVLHKIIFCL